MKKLSYFLLGAAGLMLASCSQEELVGPAPAGDGNVNVTISLPENMQSRAGSLGQGYIATQLNYAVYDSSNDALILTGVTAFPADALETTVSFNLANGKNYDLVFFAQSEASAQQGVYTFDATAKTMTVDYTKMVSESNLVDCYDCFYVNQPSGLVGTASSNISAVLVRPVAQVNWGTDDFTYDDDNDPSTPEVTNPSTNDEAAYGPNGQYIVNYLTVNAYQTLNLLTGAVSNQSTVNVPAFAAPYQEVWPGPEPTEHIYVNMVYLLAPSATSAVYDLDLSITNEGNTTSENISTSVVVSAAPVQANFRTNIYGNLLSDNVVVTVEKDPTWDTPDYDLPVGNMLYPGVYYDADTKTYTIMNAQGVENYANMVANTATTLSGYTAVLGADIDMSTVPNHTPINNNRALFDGQGHTVSNLTVSITSGNASAGFFSEAIGTVQNIIFENANIAGNYKVGVVSGDGLCATITGCTVNNSKAVSTPWKETPTSYNDGNNAGLIVGYLSNENGGGVVTGCTVTNSTVIAYRKVGGVVGYANTNGTVVEDNTLDNVTVIADMVTNAYGESNANCGQVVGNWTDNGQNTVTNVTTQVLAPNSDNAVELSSAEDLQNLAMLVNSGRAYAGQNFLLTNDLNLAGIDWTPIGNTTYPFRGFFDGGNKTISNLTVGGVGKNYVGLFGNTNYANQNGGVSSTISNLTINNATVTGRLGVAAVVGHPYGTNFSNINITGTVQINGAFYVGTVAGGNMVYGNFTDITVNVDTANSYVNGQADLAEYGYGLYIGGIVGHPAENNTYSNLTSNIPVKANECEYVGGLAGLAHYGSSWTDCSCSASVVLTNGLSEEEATQIGGITGAWMNDARGSVTFTGCSFTGTLSSSPLPDGYSLDNNSITGTAYSATANGTLYIDGDTNVASQHWQPGVTATE